MDLVQLGVRRFVRCALLLPLSDDVATVVPRHTRQGGRTARRGGGRVTIRETLLRGWIYLRNAVSTVRGQIA